MSAENEYLLAYRRLEEMRKNNPSDGQLESVRRLAESARRKLELWQIGEEEIAQLEKTGESKDALLLRSPVSGHVVAKTAVEGKAFMAGETLYEIADLSKVWLRASVPESDLPLIVTGAKAEVHLPYASGQTYESAVTFLYPHIDPQTRRAEARLEVENSGHKLRPGMWANVDIHAELGELLTIPASAAIDTGERFVAFVDKGDEHLEPRDVKIGLKTDDFYEVLGGLEDGEKVVARALFLVDSESQLKAAIAGMAAGHEH
jgi:Cu(I)/Ag(I) efflux system membrane fusion protein